MQPRVLAAAFCAALVLAGCQSADEPDPVFPARTPATSPTGSDNNVIAIVGTSSGDGSWRGDSVFRGADVAVQQLNRNRGDRPVIELVTLDDGGDAREARRLVVEQASDERTIGIIYAGPPEALPRTERALAEAGIPALLCFGDLYGARRLSPHVFQVSPSYVWAARDIARYLVRDRRYVKAATLTSDSLSGRVARRSTEEAFATLGRSLGPGETYGSAGDLGPALRRLKRARAEAIVVEAGPEIAMRVLDRLDQMGARYTGTADARIGSASTRKRARKNARRWRPQVIGFDGLLAPVPEGDRVPPGTVGADSYARGAHYLPVPSFRSFHRAYVNWWEAQPLAWERRGYEAARMIGWASATAREGTDLALALERLRGVRFGGLDVTFGPDDHTSVDQSTVGLWVRPRRGAAPESDRLPEVLPWVPLGRGFSIDGEETDILSRDWRYLFRRSPPKNGPAPKIRRARFGVTSPRSDRIH